MTKVQQANHYLKELCKDGNSSLGNALADLYEKNVAEIILWPDDNDCISYVFLTSVRYLAEVDNELVKAAAYYCAGQANCSIPVKLQIIRKSCV